MHVGCWKILKEEAKFFCSSNKSTAFLKVSEKDVIKIQARKCKVEADLSCQWFQQENDKADAKHFWIWGCMTEHCWEAWYEFSACSKKKFSITSVSVTCNECCGHLVFNKAKRKGCLNLHLKGLNVENYSMWCPMSCRGHCSTMGLCMGCKEFLLWCKCSKCF